MGPTPPPEEALEWRFYDLSFSVHKTCRYHDKMRSFYRACTTFTKVVTIVSGSGIFLLLLGDFERTAQFASASIALIAVLDLVFSPDRLAQEHQARYRDFTTLARDLEAAEQTDESYRKIRSGQLEIEHRSPPIKRLVDLMARNDECRARNFPPHCLVPLSRAQRWLGYIVTFGMARLERWKAEQYSED